ncbi:hypothetical protein FPY71_16075 [Aureimonas fodinaquatilis]|uniref:DUF302 domain-containing protein n=1 Tax=Aureimonas fodinaquatilis TaxID=2565783 RepID=A0A5B0DU28_9HYPH|nr:hypothetical protein [Aureimonas fodinaquatilis]KAA0969060.1 hypothetical protein FPY71_16075 [Aureimonas fodinaquatilis]
MFGKQSALSILAGTAFSVLLSGTPAAAQSSFSCPAEDVAPAQQTVIQSILTSGEAFDNPGLLVEAVTRLHSEGVSPLLTVNGLVAAYCPVIADDASLADSDKTQLVARFAGRVTHIAYGLESADGIILNVTFDPATMDSVTQKAREAGVSPEDWVRDIVEIALN